MRFSAAAFLALVSAVFAQTEGFDVVSKPGDGEKVPAGKTYEIVWTPDTQYGDKPVSIILIGGPSQPKQQVLDTLAKDVPSSAGSYTWEVDDSLGEEKVYGIKIELQEDPKIFQYSFPFAITPDEGHGGDHSSSTPASSAPSSTASPTKTKSHTSKPSDYPTASSTSESSTFSSVYVPSSGVPSSITSAASTEPTGTATTGTSTTATRTTVATGAATAFGANGFAVLGGLAMAALAL